MTYFAWIYCSHVRICRITYIEHSLESFEYVFEPDYSAIDSLDGFRGIQGIDLSLHKDRYVRKNMLPSFLNEHNPHPVKMSFQKAQRINGMCLLEYICHCNNEYFGDNLIIRADDDQPSH